MFRLTHKGFTLVEVMIAAAALAGLSLVLLNLTKQSTKSSVKYAFDTETNLTTNEIIGNLSSPAKCLLVLGGKNALSTPAGILHINDQYYVSSHTSAPANGYGNAGIKISNYSLASTATDLAFNVSYLNIIFENKKILGGPSTVTQKVKLYVEVNGAKEITGCHSITKHTTDIWSRGSSNIIFYPGKVGVGTTAPAFTLDVAGAINSSATISGAAITATGNMNATGSSFANSFQYTSDERLKKNVQPIINSKDILLKLRPVKFTWKNSKKDDYGFIAQDVEKLIPEITSIDEQKIMHVDYAKIIPFLVDQMQRQQREINKLKQRVK